MSRPRLTSALGHVMWMFSFIEVFCSNGGGPRNTSKGTATNRTAKWTATIPRTELSNPKDPCKDRLVCFPDIVLSTEFKNSLKIHSTFRYISVMFTSLFPVGLNDFMFPMSSLVSSCSRI